MHNGEYDGKGECSQRQKKNTAPTISAFQARQCCQRFALVGLAQSISKAMMDKRSRQPAV